MKRSVFVTFIAMSFLMASIGMTVGAQGQNGQGLMLNILDGTPFSYVGTVITVGVPGDGMVIATDSENITIFGLGPLFYWERLGVDRPVIGDVVEVEGYAVDFNGEIRNIAMNMTIDGVFIQLRDPETGRPLWKQRRGHNGGGSCGNVQ